MDMESPELDEKAKSHLRLTFKQLLRSKPISSHFWSRIKGGRLILSSNKRSASKLAGKKVNTNYSMKIADSFLGLLLVRNG